jgi:hypothetical protein
MPYLADLSFPVILFELMSIISAFSYFFIVAYDAIDFLSFFGDNLS